MKRTVYADNAATTQISDSVYDAIVPYIKDNYGNPSSKYYGVGRDANVKLSECRSIIADCLGAKENEIYFTSGGSESDNWAIKGAMKTLKKRGKTHIITTNFEHHAVLHCCQELEKDGFSVTYLPVDEDGFITAKQVEQAITENTGLVTIMFANNEVGTIQPIAEIGQVCEKAKVWFHTDAVQAVGNVPIDVKQLKTDMLSVSGHKIHGLKGIGVLYIKNGVRLENLIHGGGQENKKRAGTENLLGVVSITQAILDATKNTAKRVEYVTKLRDKIIDFVLSSLPAVRLNGGKDNRLCGNVNFSLYGVEGEAMLLKLDSYGIQVSSGSACTTGDLDPSHVLLAIGLPHVVAHGSLRITINENTTENDVDYIIECLPKVVEWVRNMSPLWQDNSLDQYKQYYKNV